MRTGKDRVQLDALDVPVSIGRRARGIHPGDWLVGDADGVYVRKRASEVVIEIARSISALKNRPRNCPSGMRLDDARKQFVVQALPISVSCRSIAPHFREDRGRWSARAKVKPIASGMRIEGQHVQLTASEQSLAATRHCDLGRRRDRRGSESHAGGLLGRDHGDGGRAGARCGRARDRRVRAGWRANRCFGISDLLAGVEHSRHQQRSGAAGISERADSDWKSASPSDLVGGDGDGVVAVRRTSRRSWAVRERLDRSGDHRTATQGRDDAGHLRLSASFRLRSVYNRGGQRGIPFPLLRRLLDDYPAYFSEREAAGSCPLRRYHRRVPGHGHLLISARKHHRRLPARAGASRRHGSSPADQLQLVQSAFLRRTWRRWPAGEDGLEHRRRGQRRGVGGHHQPARVTGGHREFLAGSWYFRRERLK